MKELFSVSSKISSAISKTSFLPVGKPSAQKYYFTKKIQAGKGME